MKINEAVLAARKAADLTQTKLADQIGKDQKVISRWEKGGRVPSAGSLLAIEEATRFAIVPYQGEWEVVRRGQVFSMLNQD